MHACKKIVRILIEEQLRRRQLGLLPTGNLAIVIPVLQNRASILPVPTTTSVCGFRCKSRLSHQGMHAMKYIMVFLTLKVIELLTCQ